MKMQKGGVIIDVPANGTDFYLRAGYKKIGGTDTEPELVQLVNSAGFEIKPEPVHPAKSQGDLPKFVPVPVPVEETWDPEIDGEPEPVLVKPLTAKQKAALAKKVVR